MKASERIKTLIKGWGGCRLEAYRCPAGVPTIGYGHTGPDVAQGLRITQAHAERLFEGDIARFEDELQRWMRIDSVPGLTQGQYDALLSFAYNTGITALRRSTLWRKVCADPSDPSVPAEFSRWVNAGGRRMPGLVARREEEARIYTGRHGGEV